MYKFAPKLLLRSTCALVLISGGMLGLLSPTVAVAAEKGASCVSCHEKQVKSFNSSFHAKIWQSANDCQTCHGNTDKHQQDPSSKTSIISFNKGGGRSAEELSQQCLNCHQKSAHLALWDMGAHKKNDVSCIACHDIHAPRSTVKQPEVCFTCHREVRSDANKISHHPIIEGKVKCSDCHNTHGTQTKHMIRAENTNQLCYKCHADKRGPFVWEHPPVEEDCMICHTSHGSRHETLLVERVQNLCQDCHDASGHPGYPNDATFGFGGTPAGKSPTAASAGYQARVVGRSCLSCHHSIHGSASFRDNRFVR